MTSDALARLLAHVTDGRILAPGSLASVDADEALDRRDEPDFEGEWERVSRALSSRAVELEGEEKILQLRELTFKRTYAAAGHGELAGAVSDDFELIGLALWFGWSDPWLNGLWSVYAAGGFPHGAIEPVDGRIEDLIP